MWSLQIEACAYVRHPFYHGVIVIAVALLWGVALEADRVILVLSSFELFHFMANLADKTGTSRDKRQLFTFILTLLLCPCIVLDFAFTFLLKLWNRTPKPGQSLLSTFCQFFHTFYNAKAITTNTQVYSVQPYLLSIIHH
jgi:hypothetical protein